MTGQEHDVIVVGGGLAGLTASRDLRNAGRSVLVLEARDRLGGRTWYRKFAHQSLNVELGGTWIDPQDQPSVANELERYGLALVQSPSYDAYIWPLADEVRTGPMPVPPNQIIDLERALFAFIAASRRVRFGVQLDEQECSDLDISFREALDELQLPRATDEFLSAWCGFVFGCVPAEVSALHLYWWLAGFHNSAWALYASLSNKFADGTTSLVDALLEDANAEIALSMPVAQIAQDDTGVKATTRRGETYRATAAVVAVPLNLWKHIEFSPPLAGAKADIARQGHVGHAVKVWALVKGPRPKFVGVGWGGGLHWLSTEYETAEGRIVVGFGSSPDRLDVTSPKAIAAAVRQYLPDADVLATDAHDWNADEFSRGTWMAYRPGWLTRHHASLQEPYGRIAFATSDIAMRWAGWIDGAIESGATAAQWINERLLETDSPRMAMSQSRSERTGAR